jgi:toxin secretion/phage lysis holin
MDKIWNWIQVGFAAVGGWLGWILGGLDGFLYALLAFVIIDYVSGVMCAAVEKKLSSEVGFRGIFKKVLIFCMVAVGHMLDIYIIGTGSTLRTAVIFFYIANEGLSLLENTTRLGLPVPQKLQDVLAQLHGKSKSDDTEDKDNES